MTTPASLASAIVPYRTALTALKTAHSPISKEQVLDLLVARDAVEAALQETTSVSTHLLIRLEELDRDLKKQRSAITKTLKLEDWRKIHHPPETHWWWYFAPPALLPCLDHPHPILEQLDWLWKLISIAALAISVTFILNTLKRVLAGGLDAAGTGAVVLQTVLALAGGSALTQQGREALESNLTRLRIPKHYWQEFGAFLSIVFLALVIAVHSFGLPQLATNLNQSGLQNYEAGRLDSALSNYQQAIALSPNYAEAHYNLGTLYEDLQKTDQAISEYQWVMQSDLAKESQPNSPERLIMLRSLNNLGRLHILKGNNQAAWVPLERGLNLVDADAAKANLEIRAEKYNLLKNLGWVRSQQKSYIAATDILDEAIDWDNQRAPAYCLKAQVLEAQKQNQQALSMWRKCNELGAISNADEAQWMGMAQEYLK